MMVVALINLLSFLDLMTISNYTETAYLNRLKGISTTAAPFHYYGLNSADSDDGSSEVTLTYASGRAIYYPSHYSSPSTNGLHREIKSTEAVVFGAAILASAGISHFSVWDAPTDGNCLYVGKFQTSLGVANPMSFGLGNPILIPSGGISVKTVAAKWGRAEVDKQLRFLTEVNLNALSVTYAALHTALNSDGTGAEVTATIRPAGRILIPANLWSAITSSGNSSQIATASVIDFGASAGSVGSLTHLSFWDAATGGNLIGFASRDPMDIAIGDPVLISVGGVIWRID